MIRHHSHTPTFVKHCKDIFEKYFQLVLVATMEKSGANDRRLLENTFQVLMEEMEKGRPESEIIEACLQFFTSATYRDKAKLLVPKTRTTARFAIRWPCLTLLTSVFTVWMASFYDLKSLRDEHCLVDHDEYTSELLRPLFNCSICEGLETIPTAENVTAEEFLVKYGYSAVPLIITGAAKVSVSRNPPISKTNVHTIC